MNTGSIKTLVEGKGFGFIVRDDQNSNDKGDVFFHKDSLEGMTFEELKVGDKVSFDIEQAEKGPRAVHVKRA